MEKPVILRFVNMKRMNLQPLNLPSFDVRVRETEDGKPGIFDIIRKKYVTLTPEEWVRQHFIHFMINSLGFPASLIVVEAALTYNRMRKRFDAVAYGPAGKPLLILECKAPAVTITQAVFDQAAMYNMTLKVNYLLVTNGMTHYACRIDHQAGTFSFLDSMPRFADIQNG